MLVSASLASAQPDVLKIVVVEGQGAINNIRLSSAKAPVIRVTDDDNRPVAGATVNFTVPEFGASAVFPNGQTVLTTTTNADGQATALGMRPNNVAGRFEIRVRATSNGRTGQALISQVNAAPAPARSGRGKKILIGGLAAGAVAGVLVAVAGGGKSAAGSSVASSSSGTVITPGSPVFGPPR